MASCEEKVESLVKKLKEQDAVLDSILGSSLSGGTVVAGPSALGEQNRWTVITDGRVTYISAPKQKLPGMPYDPTKIAVGSQVLFANVNGGLAVVDLMPKALKPGVGQIEKVADVADDGGIFISRPDGSVRIASVVAGLEAGDEVLTSGGVAVALHKKRSAKFSTFRKVHWDEIGGHREAKRQVRSAVDFILTQSQLGKQYKVQPTKGILLEGPPGNGKSLLARAAITHIAAKAGAQAIDSAFIMVTGSELLHWYVGAAEASIRNLFERARKHYAEHGYPALLVIDEAESILPRRGSRMSSDVENTIVPQFLGEMDGFHSGAPIVFLLTNLVENIDPAILREGRIDLRLHIPRPDLNDAAEIVNLYVDGLPMNRRFQNHQALASLITSIIYNDSSLRPLVSGAMLAAVVQFAAKAALDRDIASGLKIASGIDMCDVEAAISTIKKGREYAD